jgi:tRNA A-37 threonylcarbamoyl transferase component Bud32
MSATSWGSGRPVIGGSLLVFSGLLLAYIPFYTLDNFAFTGGTGELIGIVGLLFALLVLLSGAVSLLYPSMSTIGGLIGVVMSLLSIVGGTFGGMGVGTVVGVSGGVMCIYWSEGERSKVYDYLSKYKYAFSVSGLVFLWALQFWWTTTELLAFWLALGVSVPALAVSVVVQAVVSRLRGTGSSSENRREQGYGGEGGDTQPRIEGGESSGKAPNPTKDRNTASTQEWDRSSPYPSSVSVDPQGSLEYDAIEKEELVGKGGNADVYMASVDGGRIALKEPRLQGTLHKGTAERIMEEAETWDSLDEHDGIVGVIDYGSAPLPWIAMEYMDAGHIGDRAGRMGFNEALDVAVSVTQAVRHAHRMGVAHLDLKPENVLFKTTEDGEVPKVADWGLSKHLLEHSKSIEGLSPHYAAPEQFKESYGSRDDVTDIYQLGAVFYELFTGQPPYEGEPTMVMNKVMNEEPTPPSEVADVPEKLDEILLISMATEKEDRYESVLYLRDELKGLL